MLLQKDRIAHLETVTHEGKVLLFGTDVDGRIWYTTRQEGFEPQFLAAPGPGWEAWRELELPADPEDASVLTQEQAELTRTDSPTTYLVRSRYNTRTESAVAPVKLVSAQGHLYVFRQSKAGTLYCDRFVLDGGINTLSRKLEIRYQRSKQKFAPSPGFKDTLGFAALDGSYFFEPTTELCMIDDLRDGWFSVLLVPTTEHDVYRWHVFAYDGRGERLALTTLSAGEDGRFDVHDFMVYEPVSSADPTLVPRVIPGIQRRVINLGATVINGFSAVRYDVQREGAGEPKQLFKIATRIMLAVPTDKGIAALSFAIAADGTLSRIAEGATANVLRATERNVALPLSSLDEIRPYCDTTPLSHGVITRIERGTMDLRTEDQVLVTSSTAGLLATYDRVELIGTKSYDGVYPVGNLTADSFEIAVQWVDAQVGSWRKIEKEAGLRFDGMIICYEKTPDGKLKVTAPGHLLEAGDEVELTGTKGHDGPCLVTKLSDTQFVIDKPWPEGETVNLTALRRKRRGLLLDGVDDYVELPAGSLPRGKALTVSFWAKGGVTLPKNAVVLSAVSPTGQLLMRISVPDANGAVVLELDSNGQSLDKLTRAAAPSDYRDKWVHWTFVDDGLARQMRIYRNGVLWHSGPGKDRALPAAGRVRLGASAEAAAPSRFYQGELGDLRIFGRVLGDDEIRRSMYVPLTGREVGLCAYHRMTALREGTPPTIVDFSIQANDGVVLGGAYVGLVSLPRNLADGPLATKYTSPALVAVEEQGVYIEEFELRVNAGVPVSPESLATFGGAGTPIFKLTAWGKSDRGTQAKIAIPVTQEPFVALPDGFFRVSGRFTVPNGVAMVCAFELSEVSGTFVTLEVRRHRLCKLEDVVTEASYVDNAALAGLADAQAAVVGQVADLRRLEEKESALLAEEADLVERLDGLARLAEIRLQLDALRPSVTAERECERLLAEEHSRQVANPFNYYCLLGNRGGAATDRVQLVQRATLVLELQPPADVASQKWRFRAASEGVYYLECAVSGAAQRVAVPPSDTSLVELRPSADVPAQQWRPVVDGAGAYYVYNVGASSSRRLQVTKQGNLWKIELQSAGNDPRHHFTITATAEQCTTAIPDALAAWQKAKATLTRLAAELAALEAIVAAAEPERVAWRTRVHQLVAEISQVQAEMDRLNLQITSGLTSAPGAAQVMPQLAQDARSLTTLGAMLAAVRPASRISARESCEGNVELDYFDTEGRIRTTTYDAAADSRNTTFEQWLPDGARTCLSLAPRRGFVSLSTPIDLAPEYTVEAWAYLPLPARAWNVLASDPDGVEQPIVACGGVLGVRSQGFYFGTDQSLAMFAPGWHHLAVVKQGAGADASMTYYVDGKRFGSPVTPRATALLLDGLDDSVTLPTAVMPTGSQITVSFWARSNSSRPSVLLQAVGSLALPVLTIAISAADGAISFECGNDGISTDRIDKLAQRDEYRSGWSHFTFTKNALTGSMRIYRNGVLWHAEIDRKKLLPASTSVVLGRAVASAAISFEGEITNLRVWSRELSSGEVRALMGTPLPTSASGCTGYYRFEGGTATDSSGAGRHGTIVGAPQPVDVIASPSRIATLGNGPALAANRTALLPKRALRFDGIDDHVALPPMMIDGTMGLTIEAWLKVGSLKPGMRIIDIGNGVNLDNVELRNKDATGTLQLVVYQGTQPQTLEVPGVFDPGQWVHLAVTVSSGGSAKVYKNGRQLGAGPLPVAAAVVRTKGVIGRRGTSGEYAFDGQIAELRLWSAARSQLEIQDSLYNRLTGREPGLSKYWPLDDIRIDVAQGNVADLAGAQPGTAMGGVELIPDESLPVSALGTRALQDECFGRLAEVRVWDVPLSTEEVATNSKLALTGNEPGLAAYYPLSEGRGIEVRDAAGRKGPGTVMSRLGAAVMLFDGINECVTVADSPSLAPMTAYTVELWLRPNGVPATEYVGIFGKPGRCFNIWLHNTGFIQHRFRVGANPNAGAPNTAAGAIKWHQWNHVAITNDGTTARTYINGRVVAEGPTGGAVLPQAAALSIGKNPDGNDAFFNGRLADVRLWNRARTLDEIQLGMETPVTGTEAGLVAAWPMDAIKMVDGKRTLVDVTGNNRGLVVEAITVADAGLPIADRSRQLPDDGQWWGFTAITGHLRHDLMTFDGVDDHLAFPPLEVDWSKGLTLEAWVYYDSFENRSRIFAFGGVQGDAFVVAQEGTTGVLGLFVNKNGVSQAVKTNMLELGRWIHVAVTLDAAGTGCLYKNGVLVQTGPCHLPASVLRTQCYAGRSHAKGDGYFHGRMAELRIWTGARTQAELRMTMNERLTGYEPGLEGNWPLDAVIPSNRAEDRSIRARHATLTSGVGMRYNDDQLPLGADALVATEHRAADLDPLTGQPYLLMRSQFAYPTAQGAYLIADRRIEALTLDWVGNAQFAPTLLGYIEGAPPVPTENLTESDDYRGATSVELATSEDMEFRWSRNDEFGVGGSMDMFVGAQTEVMVGMYAYNKVLDLRIGARASLNFSTSSIHETNITSTSSLRIADRLELRGTPEAEPKFPHLGRRFIPKNVGYALVISSLAEVYVTRLARSRRMLSYQVRPVEGVPPEVNTVTFLMNPAYTMQGSLDGMTGSQATSGRYHRDVPKLRAELGSSYPASFYRPNEAHALEEKIQRWDMEREAYFQQFQIRPGFEEYAVPEGGSGPQFELKRKATDEVRSWPPEMQQAWNDPAVTSPPDDWQDDWTKKWDKELTAQQKAAANESKGAQANVVDATKAKILTLVDKVKSINGTLGLEEWQRKMEDIQVAAGKRNIVNTYVWDADGGLRSEAQSFATTVEHTIGGTFQLDTSLGVEAALGVSGVQVELTALVTMNMTQTVNKTETRTKGIELLVDLSGVESSGVTDHDDKPLMPGEKVDRYRFKSYYLEGTTDNYNEFFRKVVHPEWLRGSDEEAVALRQAMGKPNKTWRVLHRVTYVERPGTSRLDDRFRG